MKLSDLEIMTNEIRCQKCKMSQNHRKYELYMRVVVDATDGVWEDNTKSDTEKNTSDYHDGELYESHECYASWENAWWDHLVDNEEECKPGSIIEETLSFK